MRHGYARGHGRPRWPAASVAWFLVLAGSASAQEPQVRRLTLLEALRLAALHHPVNVAAEAAVDNAQTERLESIGSFLPSLNLNGVYTNSSNQRFDQSTGRLVSTSYTMQTQASYDIFTAGRRLVAYRSAQAQVDAADASLREAQFETSLETTSAFYEAAAAVELVNAASQRLQRAKQQMSFANTKLEVGSATRSDILRAELEQGNAELAVIDAQSGLRSARLNLGRVVGIGGEAEPSEAVLPEVAPPLPPADSLAAKAERTSPLAQTARAEHAETRASKLSSYTFYVPSLRMTGGYDWFSPTYPPTNRSWSLRLTASLPIFNGFQREATVSRAAAAERLAEARARDAAITVRAQAIDAAQRIESAGRRVVIARRGVDLAREDLRVQEERYQIDAATIVELQTSQLALTEAESEFVRSRQALGVAIATLEAVLGERVVLN